MRPEKSKRVEVNPTQAGLAGLANALGGLSFGALPEAPPKPEPVESPKKKRLGRVVLRKETAQRGGKVVIVAHDFPPTVTHSDLEALAKGLRHALGTGGAVKDRTIEVQGFQPEKVTAFLKTAGYDVAGITKG
jgi:translation initiation factor 1